MLRQDEINPINEVSKVIGTTEDNEKTKRQVRCFKDSDKICQCPVSKAGIYCGRWFPEATD
jgi:hypothetical protein